MMRLLLACLALCLLGVHAAVDSKNPFIEQRSKLFADVTSAQIKKYIATNSRKHHCILLITVDPTSEEKQSCHHCETVDPIFAKMAYNYQQQYKNATGEKRVTFARYFYDSNNYAVPQMLGLRNLPSIIAFPPKTATGFVRFDDDPGRAKDNKLLEEQNSPALAAKRRLEKAAKKMEKQGKKDTKKDAKDTKKGKKDAKGKTNPDAKPTEADTKKAKSKSSKKVAEHVTRWAARMAKREKQWNGLAFGYVDRPDDGSYNEKNILAFLRRNTGAEVKLEEDPPQNLKPKKVLTAIVLCVVVSVLGFFRLVVFPAKDPEVLVKSEQAYLRGLSTAVKYSRDDLLKNPPLQLDMRPNKRILPSFFWSILFLLAMLAFLTVTGGFYYNILNPNKWKGGKHKLISDESRGQYGIECYLIAGIGGAINFSFITLNIGSRIRFSLVRVPLVAMAFGAFAFALATMWFFFLKKNTYFLSGTNVRDTLLLIVGRVGKIIGEV
eukprot:NODE_1488_length_1717_cov_94.892095_g1411_i0.p1 GENE.NODE_1488_length_1717_cov_94.892095_g1411_i0~~NODE_1488_length_1717_cov_94.892095_g1411_i0.p1  ORF type:complete len:493 (+),score=108.71 NODE_1488_length_1717_cov_94.892095_g1411_i0:53-1531(+)